MALKSKLKLKSAPYIARMPNERMKSGKIPPIIYRCKGSLTPRQEEEK